MNSRIDDFVYSLKEVAEKLDITEKTLKEKARKGELMFPLVPITLTKEKTTKPRLVVYADHFNKAVKSSASEAWSQYLKDQKALKSKPK